MPKKQTALLHQTCPMCHEMGSLVRDSETVHCNSCGASFSLHYEVNEPAPDKAAAEQDAQFEEGSEV